MAASLFRPIRDSVRDSALRDHSPLSVPLPQMIVLAQSVPLPQMIVLEQSVPLPQMIVLLQIAVNAADVSEPQMIVEPQMFEVPAMIELPVAYEPEPTN